MGNFGIYYEKIGIFVNNEITDNFSRKIIWVSKKNLKVLLKFARKFLSKPE